MRKLLDRLRRRARLELMVSQYIASCGGPVFNKEARRQARNLIMDGPYNPLQ